MNRERRKGIDSVLHIFSLKTSRNNMLWKSDYRWSLDNSYVLKLANKTHQLISIISHKLTFKVGKGVQQGCILSPCLFNLYADYIIQNAGLHESQAGIKIPGRNINNLRYADDTTLEAESKEKIKSLSMNVKEESEKPGLKFNIQNTKIMVSSPITSWKIDGETTDTVTSLFSWAPKSLQTVITSRKLRHLPLRKKGMINGDII